MTVLCNERSTTLVYNPGMTAPRRFLVPLVQVQRRQQAAAGRVPGHVPCSSDMFLRQLQELRDMKVIP